MTGYELMRYRYVWAIYLDNLGSNLAVAGGLARAEKRGYNDGYSDGWWQNEPKTKETNSGF